MDCYFPLSGTDFEATHGPEELDQYLKHAWTGTLNYIPSDAGPGDEMGDASDDSPAEDPPEVEDEAPPAEDQPAVVSDHSSSSSSSSSSTSDDKEFPALAEAVEEPGAPEGIPP